MKSIFILLIFISSAAAVLAQDPAAALSANEQGKRVLEYFAAFNSGDEETLKKFFLENVAAGSLQQRPVEPRLAFHRQVRNDFGQFEIRKIVSIGENEIRLLVEGKTGGWASYSFAFEPSVPYKMLGWQIEETDAPAALAKPKFEAPKTSDDLIATVGKYLDELASEDRFSGVVLIAKDDRPIFENAYGMADKVKKVSNKTDTRFNLGSVNKTFTRVAIGQLVAQGKISFDDKLGKFLPDYPNKDAAEKVTVRHLVTMRSGVGDFFGPEFDAAPKDRFRKNSDFIPLFAGQPLNFEPGMKQQYSNGGYILLGAIIEKVTGQSYYDYVRENIFAPAGMPNTGSFETDKMPENTANGYMRNSPQGDWVDNAASRPFRGSAAGGGYSSAQDLLKYTIALKTGKLSIPDDNGFPQKEVGLGIAGGAPGINSIVLANKQTGYTVIVLSNYDPPSAEKPGVQIRDWTREVKE